MLTDPEPEPTVDDLAQLYADTLAGEPVWEHLSLFRQDRHRLAVGALVQRLQRSGQ